MKESLMKEITVKPVNTKSELNQFIKFPWKIYKDDKHWVPPLLMEQKTLLSKEKNPFLKRPQQNIFLLTEMVKLSVVSRRLKMIFTLNIIMTLQDNLDSLNA